MGRGRLGESAVGLGLHRMDQVGELDAVLDEERRDVVADQTPVAFLGIDLHRKAAHVARQVGRAFAAGDGGEAHEGRGALAFMLEWVGAGDVGQGVGALEEAVGAIAAGVHDPLRDVLVVEMEQLLAQMKVFEQGGAARTRFERVLVIGDRNALLRRERRYAIAGGLVGLAAGALWLFI